MLMALVVLLSSLSIPAQASTTLSPVSATQDRAFRKKKKEKSKEEKDAEEEAADEEEERKRKEKLARVIVLKWPDTSTDHTNDTVRRNVKSRISRPDAMFFPDVDLYQNGRKVKDRTVIPALQPAIVPDANIGVVGQAVRQVARIPWDGMTATQWGVKAQDLQALAEQIWFVDRVELREPLFLIYTYIGWAAENQNHPVPPFYEQIGVHTVNYYWYLAALLAYQEPALMSKITDQELAGSVNYYLQQLQQGAYPSFKVDFDLENFFDLESFDKEYEVLVNGLPKELDGNGQFDAFLGRTDIYMKRKDSGHGLSERLETVKLEEKVYFLQENARKKMGYGFVEQLFLHKNECLAEVDGDILNYLAIYAKLHAKAEIYIAAAEKGNPNRIWIWRYDRTAAHLINVGGGGDDFPVRFALVFSPGVMFNGAAVSVDDDVSDEDAIDPTSEDYITGRFDTAFRDAFIPFNFELRGHYNRLMINVGMEFGLNTREDEEGSDFMWVDRYYLPRHQSERTARAMTCEDGNDFSKTGFNNCLEDEALHRTHWNRYVYMGGGVVFGRDAGIGFGPRLALRTGWTNLPHAWQSTMHFGWAIQPPIGDFGKRFRPLVDADLRGGISYALRNSVQRLLAATNENESVVMPVFGLSIGVGFTF